MSTTIVSQLISLAQECVKEIAGDKKKVDVETLLEALASKEQKTKINEIIAKVKATRAKKLKDPEAPKRPMTSFLFFCKENRLRVREENPELEPKNITKQLGVEWKSLDADGKEKYEKMAEKAKKKYDKEMKRYVRPSDEELEKLDINQKKVRGKKEPGEPKGPKSAYLFFCEYARKKLKKDESDLKGTDILTRIGKMWQEIKDTPKANKYREMAEEDKKRYAEEMSDFKSVSSVPSSVKSKSKSASKEETKSKKSKKVDEDEEEEEPKNKKSKKSKKVEDSDVEEEEEPKSRRKSPRKRSIEVEDADVEMSED